MNLKIGSRDESQKSILKWNDKEIYFLNLSICNQTGGSQSGGLFVCDCFSASSSILANLLFVQMECGAVTDTKAKIFIGAPTKTPQSKSFNENPAK